MRGAGWVSISSIQRRHARAPAMIPVAMLYDKPENAAAEMTYIEKRGYPISYVEMGEEPDGKHTLPEDYAALYCSGRRRCIASIRIKAGRPVFEG